jgi:hypothetical protein
MSEEKINAGSDSLPIYNHYIQPNPGLPFKVGHKCLCPQYNNVNTPFRLPSRNNITL